MAGAGAKLNAAAGGQNDPQPRSEPRNYSLGLSPPDGSDSAPADQIPTAARIPGDGLLVGWSLEHEYRRRRWPIGFLGGPRYRPVRPQELKPILHEGPGHLMTIAATGAGKGVGCVVPALLRHRGPVIVIDPKGENYAITARARLEMGQKVMVLDPFEATSAAERDRLNPLDLVPKAGSRAIDECAALTDMMCVPHPSLPDPFWDSMARQWITALLLHVSLELKPAQRHLGSVRDLLWLTYADFESFWRRVHSSSEHAELRSAAAGVLSSPDRTRAAIVSTAQHQAEFLRGRAVINALRASTGSLDDVTWGEPLSIYIVIPPHRLASNSRLLRLWIGTLMTAILRRRQAPPNRTLFLLDEAAQLGRLELLKQAITLLRGYGLQTWSFWQDISQLKQLYPYDWETIYNNCRVHQNFGVTNARSARSVADLTGVHSWREILQLDHDELLLQQSGNEAVIAQRPNYLTDPAFRGSFDPNPFHSRDEERDVSAARPQRLGGGQPRSGGA